MYNDGNGIDVAEHPEYKYGFLNYIWSFKNIN